MQCIFKEKTEHTYPLSTEPILGTNLFIHYLISLRCSLYSVDSSTFLIHFWPCMTIPKCDASPGQLNFWYFLNFYLILCWRGQFRNQGKAWLSNGPWSDNFTTLCWRGESRNLSWTVLIKCTWVAIINDVTKFKRDVIYVWSLSVKSNRLPGNKWKNSLMSL